MEFIVAVLLIAVIVLFAMVLNQREAVNSIKDEAVVFRASIKDALQNIADQVDADNALLDQSSKQTIETLAVLDLKLHALAQAAGFVLENGLWVKAKPAPKPSTGVLRGAKKETITKVTTKRGNK